MDVQVFSLEVLKNSAELTRDKLNNEHVTLHIINHFEIFAIVDVVSPSKLFWPDLGLTFDGEEDYVLLKKLIEKFGEPNPFRLEVIRHLRDNPELTKNNSKVVIKGNT